MPITRLSSWSVSGSACCPPIASIGLGSILHARAALSPGVRLSTIWMPALSRTACDDAAADGATTATMRALESARDEQRPMVDLLTCEDYFSRDAKTNACRPRVIRAFLSRRRERCIAPAEGKPRIAATTVLGL